VHRADPLHGPSFSGPSSNATTVHARGVRRPALAALALAALALAALALAALALAVGNSRRTPSCEGSAIWFPAYRWSILVLPTCVDFRGRLVAGTRRVRDGLRESPTSAKEQLR
jgi:hypothetical protein